MRPDGMGSNWVALDWIEWSSIEFGAMGWGVVELDRNEKEVG
jgi:hypothetical protein